MSEQDSTLDQMVNTSTKVKAFGREYEIKRFTMGPLVRALPHLAPLGYLLRSATKADVAELLVNGLVLAGEPALGLISVATEEPIEWLEDKDPLEGLELLTEIIEKNVSYFFDSANVERIKVAFARIEKVVEQHAPKQSDGLQSSTNS